jgi:hypothetical protein
MTVKRKWAKSKWVRRKVREGRIVIDKEWYVPSDKHLKYDGRLDGLSYVFGRYRDGDGWLDYVYMWGSDRGVGRGIEVVDGHYPWAFWYKVSKTKEIQRREDERFL